MATLDEVNKSLKRTDIKGKPYIDVAQRIQGFWKLFPHGQIITEKTSDTCQRCDFIAKIYDGDTLLATGHAFEDRKGYVNQTSYVENAETSAIGRALGFLGIGSTESIASVEEVQNAIAQQANNANMQSNQQRNTPSELTEWQLRLADAMNSKIAHGWKNDALKSILEAQISKSPREMTDEECKQAIEIINNLEDKDGE